LYPRKKVSAQYVANLIDAIEAGTPLPPIVVEDRTYFVVDGVHRMRAYGAIYGNDYEVEVIVERYRTKKDLFKRAVELNTSHGLKMDKVCKVLSAKKLREMGAKLKEIAQVLHMTEKRVRCLFDECAYVRKKMEISQDGVSEIEGEIVEIEEEIPKEPESEEELSEEEKELVPMKPAARHKAGERITRKQAEWIKESCGGNNQTFYINQVIGLIETDLINLESASVVERLIKLKELLLTMDLEAHLPEKTAEA